MEYQWLEVDLGERTKITAVATQGRYGSSDWLTSYQLMFSDTGHNWKQYRQEDSIGSFPGNSNADSVVQYKLQQPAVARFLRLVPLDWNPTGRIGLRLEAYGCPYTSDMVSFDGSSSLTYWPGPAPRRGSKPVVSLKFKTMRNSGTLLQAEGQDGLELSLELDRGKLQLLLRDGTTPTFNPLTSLGSLLDDQHWHHVVLRQKNSQLNFTVDKHTKTVETPELNVGAPQDPAGPGKNFQGCLENLVYNGVNLTELAKTNDEQVDINVSTHFSYSRTLNISTFCHFTNTKVNDFH
uniref:Contactin associated protein like 3 n=1 Tax=Fundulus heteroclitus TaxID=8078 RepID=A0A3Q2PKF3_FUNHE